MPFELPDKTTLSEPRYLGLAAAIESAIAAGRLQPGERLPTHRAVAAGTGLSVQTVGRAYDRLRQQGLILGHVGRGSFVADPRAINRAPYEVPSRPASLYDLALSRPLHGALHERAMRDTLRELAAGCDPAVFLASRPNLGQPAHRAAGARWLAGLGLETTADNVVVTNGVSHGMTVALTALTRPGDVVLADSVTHHLVVAICAALGLTLVGLDCDGDGIRPDALERACAEGAPRVLVALPTLTTPSARLMSEERRRALARIAKAHDLWIVENDAYGALPEDSPPPLTAFAPDRAIHLTTFTKSSMSGLRTGYLTAPVHLQPALLSRLIALSWSATALPGEIATRWVHDGTAAELAAWQRNALANRHALVARTLAGLDWQGHPAGLHLWLRLPDDWTTEEFVHQARQLSVAVAPAAPFLTPQAPPVNAVRISVGGENDTEAFDQALDRLAGLLRTGSGRGMTTGLREL